jgi:hypothetical protein
MHIVVMASHIDAMHIMAGPKNKSRHFLQSDPDVNVHCGRKKYHFFF